MDKEYGKLLMALFAEPSMNPDVETAESIISSTIFDDRIGITENLASKVPPCLVDCERLCRMYNSLLLLDEDYQEGTILTLTTPEFINKTRIQGDARDKSECVINCFDQGRLTHPWIVKMDDKVKTSGERGSWPSPYRLDFIDLLRNLTLHALQRLFLIHI